MNPLTADGQPHPNAVFTSRHAGKPYRDSAPDPDRDLTFVEETGLAAYGVAPPVAS